MSCKMDLQNMDSINNEYQDILYTFMTSAFIYLNQFKINYSSGSRRRNSNTFSRDKVLQLLERHIALKFNKLNSNLLFER